MSSSPAAPSRPTPVIAPWVRRATLPVTILVQAAATAAVIGPTVAAPRVLERLQLGPAAVGLFVAIVYIGAMFSSQLGALLVRRWGPIRASQAALLSGGLGLALMAAASVPLAALGAFFIGLGYGPITPASSQLLSRTTDPRHYSLVFSIKQTGVPLGGVVAGLMVPALIAVGGDVAALWGLALLSAVAAISALLLNSLDHDRDASGRWPTLLQVMAPVRFVFQHPVLRSVALSSMVFSVVQLSLTSYLVSYLTGELVWALAAAGAALAASQVAGVVGRIAWGWVSDRGLGPRRTLLLLAVGMLACSLAMAFVRPGSPTAWIIALLCVYGATAVGWNGVYLATVARLVPHDQAASATAGTLFFTFFGVATGPALFGLAGTLTGSLGWAFALLALPLSWGVWTLARARWA